MTDSNKDKELDKLNNEKKKALDNQSKTAGENNSTLFAGLPKPSSPGNGGYNRFGGSGNVTPIRPYTNNVYPLPIRKGTPSITPKPSSSPGQSPLSSPTTNPLNNPLINSEPGTFLLLLEQREEINKALQPWNNNNKATPQVPKAQPALGSSSTQKFVESTNKKIKQSEQNIQNSSTPMGPPGYDPNKNNGNTYRGLVVEDPFKDLFNKPKPTNPEPTKKKKQKPGISPQRKPGGNPEEKPFKYDQFYQDIPPSPDDKQWKKVSPGDEFGISPNKKKEATKKKTPHDRERNRRHKRQTESQPTIQDGPGQAPRPMTPSELNMATNGPSTNPNTPQTPTPATPPATTPTPAQNPAAPARTPGRSSTGQPNSSGQVRTRTQRRTNEQRLADKYTNRKYDNLTQAEKDELRKGYTWSPNNDRPTLRRKDKTSNTPELHLDRNGIIRRGPAPTNNRAPSNSRDMAKNFKETYGEDVPKGDNNHHLTSVKTNNETEITKEAQRLGVRGVDDGSNLIASPSNSDAYNGTVKRTPEEQAAVDKLNANGGRVDAISHPGSHPELDKRAKELLDLESGRLKKKYKVEELKQIPEGNLRKELANSIDEVRNQLRKELVDANELIKRVQNGQLPKSALQNLPKYIKKYPLKNSKGKAPQDPKDYYKIGQEPASSQKIAQGPTGEQANKFRAVASALKARANGSQMTTYDLGNTPANLLRKEMDTPDRLAYFMARDITTKMKGTDYMKDEFQVATRGKSGEIQVYDLPSYTLNAVIDPTKQTISMRPKTPEQAAMLEVQRKETLAQAQAKPDPKKRGPERGPELGG